MEAGAASQGVHGEESPATVTYCPGAGRSAAFTLPLPGTQEGGTASCCPLCPPHRGASVLPLKGLSSQRGSHDKAPQLGAQGW